MPGVLTWSRPRWYGRWRIYHSVVGPYAFTFVHDDYDGAEDAHDDRHGNGETIEECMIQCDDIDNETP